MKNETKLGLVVIITAVIIVSLILLIVKINQDKQEKIVFKYNSFRVFKLTDSSGTYYEFEIFLNNNSMPSKINVRSDPRELEAIPIEDVKNEIITKNESYIIINPDENLTGKTTIAALEINKILDNQFLYNIETKSGLTKPYKNKEVKTCNDVSETTSIIWLKLGEETRIFKDNCIIIEGKTEEDLIKAADRLVLTLLGIMKI